MKKSLYIALFVSTGISFYFMINNIVTDSDYDTKDSIIHFLKIKNEKLSNYNYILLINDRVCNGCNPSILKSVEEFIEKHKNNKILIITSKENENNYKIKNHKYIIDRENTLGRTGYQTLNHCVLRIFKNKICKLVIIDNNNYYKIDSLLKCNVFSTF